MPAAAAAMRKQHQPQRLRREFKFAFQFDAFQGNNDSLGSHKNPSINSLPIDPVLSAFATTLTTPVPHRRKSELESPQKGTRNHEKEKNSSSWLFASSHSVFLSFRDFLCLFVAILGFLLFVAQS